MKRFLLSALIMLAASAAGYAQFHFTSIDYPGGTLTTARGINNRGDIVGAYRIVWPRHALLIRDGTFFPLAPTSILGSNYSEAFRSNDRGEVVGNYVGDDGFNKGFLLSGGVLTTLAVPGASATEVYGINEHGTIVGCWNRLDAQGNHLEEHGFLWKNGTFSEVNFPGATLTAITGINARGDFLGAWSPDLAWEIEHGFVCSNGEYISFDIPVPGSTVTQPNDINAQGHIVGLWRDAEGGFHGFLLAGGAFYNIDFPGAAQTSAWGINSAGKIVGEHYDTIGGPAHGFLAQLGK